MRSCDDVLVLDELTLLVVDEDACEVEDELNDDDGDDDELKNKPYLWTFLIVFYFIF